MTPPPPAISVRGLRKRYGNAEVVSGVSFEVAPGEILGLIGPNGAGKTTTLECLLGLRQPDEGDIRVLGIDARARPDEVRQRIGAQLQVSALPDAMTPRQALRLCGAFYRSPVEPEELLRTFGLAERSDARFSSLSAGQARRLALALAFVDDPQVVVLDEPSAGLDPASRRDLHRLIAAQRSARRAVVFTTHYLEEARSLCDRIALLDRGRLLALGPPEELVAGSKVRPRLIVELRPPLARDSLAALAGVGRCDPEGAGWSLETDSLPGTLAGLAALAAASGTELAEVRLRRPTLDDVFFELTGRSRAEDEPA